MGTEVSEGIDWHLQPSCPKRLAAMSCLPWPCACCCSCGPRASGFHCLIQQEMSSAEKSFSSGSSIMTCNNSSLLHTFCPDKRESYVASSYNLVIIHFCHNNAVK